MASALLISAETGQPIAPMQMHLRTIDAVHSTAAEVSDCDDHRLDQVEPTMREAGVSHTWLLARMKREVAIARRCKGTRCDQSGKSALVPLPRALRVWLTTHGGIVAQRGSFAALRPCVSSRKTTVGLPTPEELKATDGTQIKHRWITMGRC